ncbi:MAG: hypothetical protein JNM21_08475 [Taibaiella sp.]|nr:hypothetical protein [Taibaiella sp.]
MSKRLQLQQILSIAACTVLFSCSKPLYRPESVHEPMIAHQGEFAANGSVLIMAPYGFPSFDLGLGYSPVNRLAIKAAVRARSKADLYTLDDDDYRKTLNGTTFEGGIGYYAPVEDNIYFTVYANVMGGNNKYHDYRVSNRQTDELLDYNYTAFGIQPAVLFVKRRARMATGIRAGLYQYNIKQFVNTSNPDYYGVKEGKLYPVFEPYYTIEVGGEHIRFFGQAGFSIVPAALTTDSDNFFPKLSIGINLRFGGTK